MAIKKTESSAPKAVKRSEAPKPKQAVKAPEVKKDNDQAKKTDSKDEVRLSNEVKGDKETRRSGDVEKDENGKPVDENGKPVDENGNPVDENGKPIDEEKEQMKKEIEESLAVASRPEDPRQLLRPSRPSSPRPADRSISSFLRWLWLCSLNPAWAWARTEDLAEDSATATRRTGNSLSTVWAGRVPAPGGFATSWPLCTLRPADPATAASVRKPTSWSSKL